MRKTNTPLILAGTGRSGTSWLLDVFSLLWHYRPIFEPLHTQQVPEAKGLLRLYLTSEETHSQLREHLEKVFWGKPENAWIRWMHMGITTNTPLSRKSLQYVYNLPKYRFWAKNRVVKLINGNLLLEWLQENFDVSIIFVIRHPCAVVASQKKMGWASGLDCFTQQKKLVNDYLNPFLPLVDSVNNLTENFTLRWCIENYVPLTQARKGRINIIPLFYEDIVMNPVEMLKKTLMNLQYSAKEIERFCIKFSKRQKPRKESLIKWRKNLSGEEISAILDFTKKFGLNFYGEAELPDKTIFEDFMRKDACASSQLISPDKA